MTLKNKIVSADEAIAIVRDGDTICVSGFVGIGTPDGELLRVKDAKGRTDYIRDDQGNVVKSHLNEALLQQISGATPGGATRGGVRRRRHDDSVRPPDRVVLQGMAVYGFDEGAEEGRDLDVAMIGDHKRQMLAGARLRGIVRRQGRGRVGVDDVRIHGGEDSLRGGGDRRPEPHRAGLHAADVDPADVLPLGNPRIRPARDDGDLVAPADEFRGESGDVGLNAPDVRLEPGTHLDDPHGISKSGCGAR